LEVGERSKCKNGEKKRGKKERKLSSVDNTYHGQIAHSLSSKMFHP